MKKSLISLPLLALTLTFAGAAEASGGHGPGHGHGKAKGHHKFKHGHRHEVVHYYVPVEPPLPAVVYHAPPAPAPQPYYRSSSPDRRSTTGLAGGVVGSALGYQVGNGSPIATGVGAAAGSLIGNEIAK